MNRPNNKNDREFNTRSFFSVANPRFERVSCFNLKAKRSFTQIVEVLQRFETVSMYSRLLLGFRRRDFNLLYSANLASAYSTNPHSMVERLT